MEALVYVCDEFSPVDVDASSLFALAEEDPLKLFDEYVRPFVEDYVGEILGALAPSGSPQGKGDGLGGAQSASAHLHLSGEGVAGAGAGHVPAQGGEDLHAVGGSGL
ncbi:hypothetical protein [Pyrobaculum arsenaticum]|uniref:hypothetical protein n=1 Tax=Pyrobaculum arsenaticum TaxID=121277 RepID=UPI001F4D1A74|nr:hypothetical protein [Pyrobaculum arsenaticum]